MHKLKKLISVRLDVERSQVGEVMLLLHGTRGVASFDFVDGHPKRANGVEHVGGDEPKPRPLGRPRGSAKRKRKTRFMGAVSGLEAVMLLLKKKPMRLSELSEAFVKEGRSRASPSGLLHALRQDGLIDSGDKGYMLTRKGRDKARYIKPKTATAAEDATS